MPEDTRDLRVRLSFEHGDTKQQIAAIKGELKRLDSEFAAAGAAAGGMSGGLNAAGAQADHLRQKLALQAQITQRYGEAVRQANEKLARSVQAHEKQGQQLEQARAKREALKSQIDALKAAMEAEKKANGDNTMAYLEMDEQLDRLTADMAANKEEITRLEQAYSRSDAAIQRNDRALQQLQTAESQSRAAEAALRGELERTETQARSHAQQLEQLAEKQKALADSATQAGQAQEKLGGVLSKGSAAIVAAGTAAAGAAISWESSFAGVRKTVNGTEEELAQLEEALLGMEKPTSYADLANIAAGAGQLGIETQNVAAFTATMADLAETTDLTADAAATAFAQYANITRMPQTEIDRLGSVTVALGNNLATTESKIVDFATAISAAGSQAGMTDQQIFGIGAGLSSLGLEAQAGGTAFSKAIVAMKVAVETGSEDLQGYADVCGMTAEQFQQAFSADAAGTFIRFVQGLSSGSSSALVMLDQLGITETRLRDTLLRASNASDLLTKSVGLANRAWDENTALASEAAVRYNTTASRMQMLGKQAQRTAMSFGNTLMPAVRDGLSVAESALDKFNALDEGQRKNILTWAAYAAAVGPAISLIGKANTGIGSVMSGLSSLTQHMAGASSAAGGLLSGLAQLLGPAGIAAVAVAAGIGAYKFYDWASGAKAAREATKALNDEAQTWLSTQASTIFDTGTADPLARFGLSREAFEKDDTVEAAEDWIASLTEVWTDGKAETDEIVKQFSDSFAATSDKAREKIESQRSLLEGYNALTPEKQAQMDADMAQLEAWDAEVAALLKKRQNGYLTDEDQSRLNEIVQARSEIEVRWTMADEGDGYDQIIATMQAEVDRLRAAGESDPTLYGDAMKALAEGRDAYNQQLAKSYDAEHAQIMQIEDETARMAALETLNQRYNQQRLEGEEAYNQAAREAGAAAWEAGDYGEQIDQIDQLVALMTSADGVDIPAVKTLAEGMDEGALTSMLALVEQLKAAGATDEDLQALGIDYDDLMHKINEARDIAENTEGLEGVSDMIGKALPEELQRVLVGLDLTQAAEDWAEFAEGGSLPKIKAGVEATISPEDVTVTGKVAMDGEVQTVTTKEGESYKITGFKVGVDGQLSEITTEDGKTYSVAGFKVGVDGQLEEITTADGETYAIEGFKVGVDGQLGTITAEDGKEYQVTGYTVGVDGKLQTVTAENGKTYTVTDADVQVPARLTLGGMDLKALAAWQRQHPEIKLTGTKAKVGVELGADWQSDLEAAWAAGKLAVYGADGLPMEVTPEVVSMITAQDIAMVDEDGTLHVIVVPEVGSPEGLETTQETMEQKPVESTPMAFLAPLTQSTQDKVAEIEAQTEALRQYREEAEAAREEGDIFNAQQIEYNAQGTQNNLASAVGNMTEEDVSAVGARIENLMAAIQQGGTAEELAAWGEELQGLLDVVNALDTNGTGMDISAGLAEGMQQYDFGGDTATLAADIQSAIDTAVGRGSPAELTKPTGYDVAAGLAVGMGQFDFAAAATTVSGNLLSGMSDLAGQGQDIGGNFGAGLYEGFLAKADALVQLAQETARQVTAAFENSWEIHSPSRVAQHLTEMFGAGLEKGEESWPTISEDLLEGDILAARRGVANVVNNSSDSRDMSVKSDIHVERMEVRDDRDLHDLSRELYYMARADQRGRGK